MAYEDFFDPIQPTGGVDPYADFFGSSEPSNEDSFLSAVEKGAGTTWSNIKSTVNALLGNSIGVEQNLAETQAIGATPSQQAFRNQLAVNQDAGDESFLDAIGNVASAIWDEPQGAFHELGAQLPNSGAVLGGMGVGALAGSAAGPIGTIVGGIVGMFVGNSSIEIGALAKQYAEGGLTEDERGNALSEGAVKAGVVTAVDTVTLGGNKYLLGIPGRAAEKAVTKTLLDSGLDVTNHALVKKTLTSNPELLRKTLEAGAAAANEAFTVGKRAGVGATAFALETLGEGTGEYLGELAAGHEASKTEAVLESLMSAPLSIGELHVAKQLNSPGALTSIAQATTVDDALVAAENAAGSIIPAASDQAIRNQRDIEVALKAQVDQDTIDSIFGFEDPPRPKSMDSTPGVAETIDKATGVNRKGMLSQADFLTQGDVNQASIDAMPEDLLTSEEKQTNQKIETDRQLREELRQRLANEELATPEARAQRDSLLAEWDADLQTQQKVGEKPTNPAMAKALEKAGLITRQQARDNDVFFNPRQGEEINIAAHESATSPLNDRADPTPAQIEAGNYKKGKVRVNGLDLSIENPKGSVRTGTDPGGQKWSQTMNNHYGYIRGSVGHDKDHVDVFLGDRPQDPNLPVFVVDQVKQDGTFDEHKVMLGFASQEEAVAAYKSNYSEGWSGLRSVKQMSLPEFKTWVKDPVNTSRLANLVKYKDAPSAKGETSEDVQFSPRQSETTQRKGTEVVFEVAPNPKDVALTRDWNTLPDSEKRKAAKTVINDVVKKIAKRHGVAAKITEQQGGYLDESNTSFSLSLPTRTSHEVIAEVTKELGNVLSQDSMMVLTDSDIAGAEPVGVVTVNLPSNSSPFIIRRVYNKLRKLKVGGEQVVSGHTTKNGQMAILNYSNLSTEELANLIDGELDGKYDVDIGETKAWFPSSEEYTDATSSRQEGSAVPEGSPVSRYPSDLREQAKQVVQDYAARGRASRKRSVKSKTPKLSPRQSPRLSDGREATPGGRPTANTRLLEERVGLPRDSVKEVGVRDTSALGRFARDFVKGILGKTVIFYDASATRFQNNGLVLAGRPDLVFIDVNADRPHMAVLGHELLHILRRDNPQLYADLKAALMPLVQEYGKYRDWTNANYQEYTGKTLPDHIIVEEMIADLMGDGFMDPAFWERLHQKSPGLFKRVVTAVHAYLDALVSRLVGTNLKGTKYFRDYKKARDLAADAMSKFAEEKVAPLRLIKLSEEYVVAETGETVILEESADTLYKQHIQRLQGLHDLMRCIG